MKVEYELSGEASIEAFVETLKNQASPEKNYRTIRDKDFNEKEYYTVNHYKPDAGGFKISKFYECKDFEYVWIEEAEIEFAFEKDTHKLAFIVNYKDMAHFKRKESFIARAAEEARRRLLKQWKEMPEPKDSWETFKRKNWR